MERLIRNMKNFLFFLFWMAFICLIFACTFYLIAIICYDDEAGWFMKIFSAFSLVVSAAALTEFIWSKFVKFFLDRS